MEGGYFLDYSLEGKNDKILLGDERIIEWQVDPTWQFNPFFMVLILYRLLLLFTGWKKSL